MVFTLKFPAPWKGPLTFGGAEVAPCSGTDLLRSPSPRFQSMSFPSMECCSRPGNPGKPRRRDAIHAQLELRSSMASSRQQQRLSPLETLWNPLLHPYPLWLMGLLDLDETTSSAIGSAYWSRMLQTADVTHAAKFPRSPWFLFFELLGPACGADSSSITIDGYRLFMNEVLPMRYE